MHLMFTTKTMEAPYSFLSTALRSSNQPVESFSDITGEGFKETFLSAKRVKVQNEEETPWLIFVWFIIQGRDVYTFLPKTVSLEVQMDAFPLQMCSKCRYSAKIKIKTQWKILEVLWCLHLIRNTIKIAHEYVCSHNKYGGRQLQPHSKQVSDDANDKTNTQRKMQTKNSAITNTFLHHTWSTTGCSYWWTKKHF